MIIILDTNSAMAALIRDSLSRKIIVISGFRFVYPEEAMEEIMEHKQEIIEKAGISEADFEKLLKILLDYIEILPKEKYHAHMEEAKIIMQKIDPDDVIFAAAALSLPESIVWSEDKDWEKQSRIIYMKTKDIADAAGLI